LPNDCDETEPEKREGRNFRSFFSEIAMDYFSPGMSGGWGLMGLSGLLGSGGSGNDEGEKKNDGC
jgi:hypothetical protein